MVVIYPDGFELVVFSQRDMAKSNNSWVQKQLSNKCEAFFKKTTHESACKQITACHRLDIIILIPTLPSSTLARMILR